MRYASDSQERNEKGKKAISIFFCYAHKDQKYVNDLEQQLRILKHRLNIEWAGREVTARREWVETFDKRIATADIILPLLSADFLASDYLLSQDMQEAVDRQQKKDLRIIPIQLRPVNYKNTYIETFQSLPQNNKPVSSWRDRDKAYVDISNGLQGIIEEILSSASEELPSRKETITTYQIDTKELTSDPIWDTDFDESTQIKDMQEAEREIKVVSPSIDRSSYPLALSNEKPKKKKNKEPTTKANKTSSNFIEQLSFLTEPSPERGLNQAPNKNMTGVYEYSRSQAQHELSNDQPQKALEILEDVDVGSVPSKQRWRIAALRGHCYFGLGKFLPARKEYNDALSEKPIIVPKEQIIEEGILYFKAAETNKELGNLTEAVDLYHRALAQRNEQTQIGYLADVHWGLALALFEQIQLDSRHPSDLDDEQKQRLQEISSHAETARQLYHISGDAINAASITCDMALFEHTTGNLTSASKHLKDVLEVWTPMIRLKAGNTKESRKRVREYNNIISAASCYLAGIEIEKEQYQDALGHVQVAEETAVKSYLIRQVEAAMMRGRFLETRNLNDPDIEAALQQAVDIVSNTDLLGAQIRAHDLLGRHLLKIGEVDRGNEELDQAQKISQTAIFSH